MYYFNNMKAIVNQLKLKWQYGIHYGHKLEQK